MFLVKSGVMPHQINLVCELQWAHDIPCLKGPEEWTNYFLRSARRIASDFGLSDAACSVES